MKHNSGRGGARSGAGRKRGIKTGAQVDNVNRRKRYQVRLPYYLIEWLREQDKSAGRIIEGALIDVHGKSICEHKERDL